MTAKRLGFAASIVLTMAFARATNAAELKVLCIPGLKAAVNELLPSFERASGRKVVMTYEIYTGQKQRLESGDFDVALFGKAQIAELEKQNRVVAGSGVDVAATSIGVAIRKGAPKPDISSEAAFEQTLLAAKSITYTKESATGFYVTKLLDRLNLTDKLKGKLIYQTSGGATAPAVAKGEAEMALVLISDIIATNGVELAGPLPPTLQNAVMQTAAVGTNTKEPKEAEAFVKYLTSPAATSVFKAKGLDTPAR